jgi:hypothetical protein
MVDEMTTAALRQLLYEKGYPPQFEVDHHTYANACQEVLSDLAGKGEYMDVVDVWIGRHRGLMFKNTELILRNGA